MEERGQHCVTCPLGADISSAVSRGQSGCTLLTSAIPGIPFRACSGRGNLQMEEVVSLQNERRRKQVGLSLMLSFEGLYCGSVRECL